MGDSPGGPDGGALDAHRARVLEEVRALYNDGSLYGELSQLKHALQSARQAEMAGAPGSVVVGALLHDVGWKLAGIASERSGGAGAGLVTGADGRPPAGSIAERMGILEFCGNAGGGAEELRAQHDVVGSVWARMMGAS